MYKYIQHNSANDDTQYARPSVVSIAQQSLLDQNLASLLKSPGNRHDITTGEEHNLTRIAGV